MTSQGTDHEKVAAQEIMGAINTMMTDSDVVGRMLANDHRTLQQSFMGIVVGFLNGMADHADTDRFDARNEASVQLAARIRHDADLQEREALPFI